MGASASEPSRLRFGVFELDLATGELRKAGTLIHLPPQPLKILALLASRSGQLVTRQEIQQKVWGSETFVDFEHGLNFAIKTIRDALGDDAETPRYVETLPRRGYRFMAPVETARRVVSEEEALHRSVSTAHGGAPAAAPEEVGAHGVRPDVVAMGTRRVPLQKRWRLVLAAMGIVGVLAPLLALNVAGLRERMLRAVAAVSDRRTAMRTSPLQKIESIAVLPLENLSGDPAQEYFADGMTEALISDLGKISALRVISRTSVMRFKGARPAGGLAEIAQKLNVDAVVEGSVMRSGDRVRITANLLDARSERHLWAESYDRDLHDVLSLQSEVARAIASEIKIKVTPQEQTRLAQARPVNPEAHDLYLKGSDALRREEAQKALQYFEKAIEKDADFARAFVGIATAYASLGEDVKWKANARKAVELDDNLADAHVSLAYALFYVDWDWVGGEREIKRALEINPNSDSARGIYLGYLILLGRPGEGIAEARRQVELNPLVAWPYHRLGHAYYFAREYDDALAQFEKAKLLPQIPGLEESPGWFQAQYFGLAYAGKGMYKEAIAEFQRMPEDSPYKLGLLGNAYARAGNKAEARKITQALAEISARKRGGNYALAVVYAGLGENDKAIQSLEEAYRTRTFSPYDDSLVHMRADPLLDPLRSDPRFQDLLRRMNFPP